MIGWMQRILALMLIMAVCFSWGLRTGLTPSYRRPDYAVLDAAQLSYVAEGLQERIAALTDELARVTALQQAKLDEQ